MIEVDHDLPRLLTDDGRGSALEVERASMLVDAHAITNVEARQNLEGLRCCKDPETRVDHISEKPEILIVRAVGYLLDQGFEVAIAREGRLVDVGRCHERKRRAVALFRSALPSHGPESSFKSQQHLLRLVCIIFLRRARVASAGVYERLCWEILSGQGKEKRVE